MPDIHMGTISTCHLFGVQWNNRLFLQSWTRSSLHTHHTILSHHPCPTLTKPTKDEPSHLKVLHFRWSLRVLGSAGAIRRPTESNLPRFGAATTASAITLGRLRCRIERVLQHQVIHRCFLVGVLETLKESCDSPVITMSKHNQFSNCSVAVNKVRSNHVFRRRINM